jgi:lactoylglutathione lyase
MNSSNVQTMHLEYCGIRVTNLERSVKFYTEVLGLKEIFRGDFREYGAGIFVKLRDEKSGQHLELNWYPEGSKFNVPYNVGESLDHIGFVVDDVEETYYELLKKGAKPTLITPSMTGGWVAHVEDPDGIWIEIFKHPAPK